MTEVEAFEGLAADCPPAIRHQQRLIDVPYVGFDGREHQGQLVVHQELVDDVKAAFQAAFEERFPIEKVIPISHPKYRRNGKWDDDASMADNNTSAFNYRMVTGGKGLSQHAYGRAIDVNPVQNPYIRDGKTLPPLAKYVPEDRGTLRADSAMVRVFKQRGWEWGGDWTSMKDYQHFQKKEGAR
jgi:hypothetical protein